jgi:hypothetical protein
MKAGVDDPVKIASLGIEAFETGVLGPEIKPSRLTFGLRGTEGVRRDASHTLRKKCFDLEK